MMKITVLIVTYKRETLLLNCLKSLKQLQQYFDLEVVLFVNGETLSPLTKTRVQDSVQNLTILEEKRTTPGIARNKALQSAMGDWVFFLDDDAYLPDDYAQKVSKLMRENPSFQCFGGPDVMPSHSDSFQESLAITLSSPFCTGPTFRRHKIQEKMPYQAGEKDLTSCHLWVKKDILIKNNIKFAETFHRGEETTFLQDITNSKIVMWAVPSLFVFHERRRHFKELLRPLFYGGYYRSHITNSVWSMFSLPALMVLMHSLLFISLPAFIVLAEVYFLMAASMSFYLCWKAKRMERIPMVIVLHYVIVTLYGCGYLFERLTRLKTIISS